MLDLVLQLGPCRVEPVGGRLLRVRGGGDRPEVVAAIERAGGERDGTGDFWWIEARRFRAFNHELWRVADLFSRCRKGKTRYCSGTRTVRPGVSMSRRSLLDWKCEPGV